jgi:signal transduction histidine kinase
MVRVSRYIGKGTGYVREHPQLLLTLVLIVVIPVAFVISGQQFLNASRTNQERLEKDRIGILHDATIRLLNAESFDPVRMQEHVLSITAQNPDITQFEIVRKEGSAYKILNARDQDRVGTVHEDDSLYTVSLVNPDDSVIVPYAQGGVRYWQGFRYVARDSGEEYFIFTETSLKYVDELLGGNIRQAYLWLLLILLVVMTLLLRHVKLIDYSYLYREMKKANEMKDLFTNMIAHELRAPLTAIRGYASIIRENGALDGATREQARRIEDSAARLVLVVSDLLDVARIQSGKLSVVKESFHLSGLVRSVVESLGPIAAEKNITLAINDPYGDLMLKGDEKRLFQALTNVMSNAIKYTPKGAVRVTLEKFSDRVELRVADTGMGISSDNQKNLFTPFFRVESADMSTITGTGLGMWITKQIIELMGGSIGVESIRGVGTHVVITLPV